MSLSNSRHKLDQVLLSEKSTEEIEHAVIDWFQALGDWENQDTFEAAFQDSRMTARNINAKGRGGSFDVKNIDGKNEREMHLNNTKQGIMERLDYKKFLHNLDKDCRSFKNELGLHDLSASLLTPDRKINKQLKHYENAMAVFMPVPMPEDHEMFYRIQDMVKGELKDNPYAAKQYQLMKSQLTRIKLAQSSDMGCKFVDISKPDDKHGKFRYGITGTIIRDNMRIGRKASQEELDHRKIAARKYKGILARLDGKKIVNEIVVAYRAHASPFFPMFGVWDEKEEGYHIEAKNGEKMFVTNKGICR